MCYPKCDTFRFLSSDALGEGCNTFPLFVYASGSYSIETQCCLKAGYCRTALRISVAVRVHSESVMKSHTTLWFPQGHTRQVTVNRGVAFKEWTFLFIETLSSTV